MLLCAPAGSLTRTVGGGRRWRHGGSVCRAACGPRCVCDTLLALVFIKRPARRLDKQQFQAIAPGSKQTPYVYRANAPMGAFRNRFHDGSEGGFAPTFTVLSSTLHYVRCQSSPTESLSHTRFKVEPESYTTTRLAYLLDKMESFHRPHHRLLPRDNILSHLQSTIHSPDAHHELGASPIKTLSSHRTYTLVRPSARSSPYTIVAPLSLFACNRL